jgi:ankyrin repeat protein
MSLQWVRLMGPIIFCFTLLSGCAHETKNLGQLAEPLKISMADCIPLVTNDEAGLLLQNIESCRDYQNADGVSTLMMAIYKNRKNIFDLLIKANANIQLLDGAGTDALFYAVNFHRVDMIKELRARGAKIRMSHLGVNALWVALQKSKIDVLTSIDPTMEEVNLQGDDGWNSVYFAIRRQEEAALDLI